MEKTVRIEPLNPLTEQEYEKLKEGLKKIKGFRFATRAKITIE